MRRQWLHRPGQARRYAGQGRPWLPDRGQALGAEADQAQEWAEAGTGTGARQSQFAGQGGASFPGDQAPVRLHQGALPWTGEEHRAGADAVRAVEPVDGSQAVVDHRGEVAPVKREIP